MNVNINNNNYKEQFLACKCGKNPEPRWIKSEIDGKLKPVAPYRGHNNEELCCKCANFCSQCGRQEKITYHYNSFGEWHEKESEMAFDFEDTKDNPSGVWALRFCRQCRPSMYSYRTSTPLNYYTYQEIKPGSQPTAKPNPSANSDNQLPKNPGREELTQPCANCGKLVEERKWVSNTNGKIFCSSECVSGRQDKSVKSNPGNEVPKSSVQKSEENKDNQSSEVKANPPAESENSTGKISETNSSQSETPKPEKSSSGELDIKSLLQYFQKNHISRISLNSDGNLQIEYSNQQEAKIITNAEGQEQQILNFLQKTGQRSLDQAKLSQMNTSSQSSFPKSDYTPYLVGGIGGVILVVGIASYRLGQWKSRKIKK